MFNVYSISSSLHLVIFVLAVNPGLPDGLDGQPGGAPRTRISGEKSLSILHSEGQAYAE